MGYILLTPLVVVFFFFIVLACPQLVLDGSFDIIKPRLSTSKQQRCRLNSRPRPRIEPRAAGWEARTLSTVLCGPPSYSPLCLAILSSIIFSTDCEEFFHSTIATSFFLVEKKIVAPEFFLTGPVKFFCCCWNRNRFWPKKIKKMDPNFVWTKIPRGRGYLRIAGKYVS